jgi:hypothetical protein
MLQWVFRWFGHQPRCLWVLYRFSFRRHCRPINAERARARIARRDSVERRDVFRTPMVFLAYLSLSSPPISCSSSHARLSMSGGPGNSHEYPCFDDMYRNGSVQERFGFGRIGVQPYALASHRFEPCEITPQHAATVRMPSGRVSVIIVPVTPCSVLA